MPRPKGAATLRRLLLCALALAGAVTTSLSIATRTRGDEPEARIRPNDNVQVTGRLIDGTLELNLELQKGVWHPYGDDEPGVEVLAFAETGDQPQIPGPQVRVPLGTEIHASVKNPLDVTLVVHGLSERRVEALDSLVVPPRSVRAVRFTADAEGTFFYWGTTSGALLGDRYYEDSQLGGAFIVDSPDATPVADRVMVLGVYVDGKTPEGEPDLWREVLVINGRSWPYTERLTYQIGDSIRWRLINASSAPHPMHLHGFFYRVDARGDIARDTLYWPAQRRMAVTERMLPGTTMSMVWSPDRPGGWIFHCHLSWHVIPNPKLGAEFQSDERREAQVMLAEGHHDPDHHVVKGMGGLMMAMYVQPPEGWEPNEPKRRQLRLFVQSDSMAGERRRFGYVLQHGEVEPAPDSVLIPGSTLVLWKGEPTSVWVINRTGEPTQVHWHGLEIESYFDGVAGVGGYPARLTPAILPGDSFEMRITPPRAGSYMYHTHVNDIRQQSGGLYGPFIVLEAGVPWDPELDHILILGDAPESEDEMPVLNGQFQPPPLQLREGVAHRLRLMNITLGRPNVRVILLRDGAPVRWRRLAKDGFDLRPEQREVVPAEQLVSIGETYDVEFVPLSADPLRLEVRTGSGRLLITRKVNVLPD